MYTEYKISDKAINSFPKNYKLCYIEPISRTIYDYDERSKAIINSPEFKWSDRENSWRLNSLEVDNPEYVPGESQFYAYFTPVDLDKQWGDDWNDAPYDCNAGEPYDDYYDENDKRTEIEIVKIKFGVKSDDFTLPSEYGGYYGGNTPFSVQTINQGAVAWLFDTNGKQGTAIYAGDSIKTFKQKLKQIEKNHPNWTIPTEDEDY